MFNIIRFISQYIIIIIIYNLFLQYMLYMLNILINFIVIIIKYQFNMVFDY